MKIPDPDGNDIAFAEPPDATADDQLTTGTAHLGPDFVTATSASYLRIEEQELEASGRNRALRRSSRQLG